MRTSTQMKYVCAAALAVSGIIATVALASPPANFTGEGLVAADLSKLANVNAVGGTIKFQTTQGTDAAVVKLVFGANSRSGWHHHPGMVLVQVAQGRVTVTDGACASKTYGAGLSNGSVFVEGEAIHNVSSSAGAVAYATAIVKEANPKVFRIEDSAPACARAE
jgi:quercetin dioxygenase-like cupin family protein